MPSGIKRTHEEFLNEISANNPNIQVLGNYQKNILPIKCRCLICGHEWSPTPKALLKGHGCPRCGNNVKLTHEEFVENLRKRNAHFNTFALLGKYDGMSKHLKCKCLICGTEWSPKANDLIRSGSGCPSCAGHIIYTHDRFLQDIKKKNKYASSIEILSQYEGMTKHIQCRCKTCNHIWNPIASSLIQGTGCPECAKKRLAVIGRDQLKKIRRPGKMSQDAFIKNFNIKNPHANTIKLYTKYNGANEPIDCKCMVCGYEWRTMATVLLRGSGCPRCTHTSTSFMEQYLLCALSKAIGNDNIIHRDKYSIGKELDIYVPNKNFAIEIGSWNWHKAVFKKDIEKKEECRRNNIRLIIIYDSCFDEKIPVDEDIWSYEYDLGNEKGHKTLKTIVKKCLQNIDVSYSFSDQDWDEITALAYNASRKVTHKDFLEKLSLKNPHYQDLILLTEYKHAHYKIKCKCKKCGHEWETAASDLLKGTGCPICQMKSVGAKRSKKEQVLEWRRQNPQGTKIQCEKTTDISRMTIYKWWDSFD